MTGPDPRLGEIEARLGEIQADGAKAALWRTHTVAYLLTELRKRDDALAKVEALHKPIDAAMYAGNGVHKVKVCTGCGTDDGNWQRWPCPTRAAVTAAKGDGE